VHNRGILKGEFTVDTTWPTRLRYLIGGFFAVGCIVGLSGAVFAPSDDKKVFLTLMALSAGGLLLVWASPQLSEFSIGLDGVKAKLDRVENKLDKVQELQVKMAHQINLDLLSKRFDAYGDLWSRTQPAAIYTAQEFSQKEAREFLEGLSKWYFSVTGGLFLTVRARDFYFSLQRLLRTVGGLPGWKCNTRPGDPKEVFTAILNEVAKGRPLLEAQVTLLVEKHPEKLDPECWEELCQALSAKLKCLVDANDPNAGEAIFNAIQQVSSVLRTNLTHELHSRLDVEWPTGIDRPKTEKENVQDSPA
jgi:hypothetical protein